MSDEFDDLKRAWDDATPAPDPARRAEALALAMKNFDRLQETEETARQTSEAPKTGPFRGVRQMIAQFSTRGILTATTALAAVALVAVLPVLRDTPDAPSNGVLDMFSPGADAPVPSTTTSAPQPQLAPPAESMVKRAPDPVAPAADPAPSAGRAHNAANPPVARPMNRAANTQSGGLMSLSPEGGSPGQLLGLPADTRPLSEATSDRFPEVEANGLKVTVEEPVSTFSIDVDTASWSMLRNYLSNGQLPPDGAVRIEEMVNYFTYDYPAPEGEVPFATSVGVTDTPWREGTQIVHIGLQGALPAERPPMNLVFLIDTSGSMNQPNKLPLLKQSFRLMLGQLTEADSVSIVTYAGSAGRVLDPTPATDRDTILAALDRLEAGGSTAGQAGLQQAYATAQEMSEAGEVSRVILATDGDFNVGISDPDDLEAFIADKREDGTYLSVLGFGRGNLNDAGMQALAQAGNGMAAYIDTLAEAQKVLVDQLTGALVPIADDVKIQVEFNPAAVAEYRLIGYETRALNREDFNNDRVDAGEIGAGHQVTALYEITPVGSDARLTDPLRYSAAAPAGETDELGFLRLRYKAPGEAESRLIETPIAADAEPLAEADFALAIAGFGQILRGSDLIGSWSMGDAIALAQGARGTDPYGYRQEAITLMRLAESLDR
ncbi:vWA domain-containing protein [Pseudoponticoccus marisrubri]|uniref:VWFA domain-containing protein n=1 Tax=Pseudoponticoccus marisrubri TaxID=1685382 RepID=A0A0W7WJ97_9RHOB|nr:VWA domain-containing protein [Pseudoponticoccus marisrubri]KUF10622.1 hypothetical protein AVJ23_12170 [Pseudoponticoccus marisrubri]